MNKLFQIAAILALSTLFITACSQPGQQPTAGSTNSASTASNTAVNTSAKNLCDLLPVSEMSKLAATTFTKTEHKVDNSDNPAITDCFYTDDQGNSVAIIANYDNAYRTAKQSYQEVVDFQAAREKDFPAQEVSGVGEAAFITPTGVITQITAVNKNVCRVTLSLYNKSDKATQKDQVIAIAKRAFEVL